MNRYPKDHCSFAYVDYTTHPGNSAIAISGQRRINPYLRTDRELKYRTGITITRRKSFRSGKPALDAVRDDEWPQIMKVIASLCYDYCVDADHVTNAETVQA